MEKHWQKGTHPGTVMHLQTHFKMSDTKVSPVTDKAAPLLFNPYLSNVFPGRNDVYEMQRRIGAAIGRYSLLSEATWQCISRGDGGTKPSVLRFMSNLLHPNLTALP